MTLYCNPHDQVISATPVQGIGWRGMSAGEIAATSGLGVLTQRVFAQGFEVGSSAKLYDYWADHHRKGLKPGREYFYRFRSARHLSEVGRTLTSPALHETPAALAMALRARGAETRERHQELLAGLDRLASELRGAR